MWRALSVARGDVVMYLDCRHDRLRRPLRVRVARSTARLPGAPLRQGRLQPALAQRCGGRDGGKRPRDRADGEAALQSLLSGADGLRPAARGRAGGAARAALLDPVLHGLRGRDRDADRRARGSAGSMRWPRSTSGRAPTATRASTRSAGCRTRCCARSRLVSAPTGGCANRPATTHTFRRSARTHRSNLDRTDVAVVERPPMAELVCSRVALRCVYTDLDNTMLGKGASILRDAEGNFSLLAIRALEACHRAGVEVVIKSGRRKAQVYEDARLIGQPAYIYEMGCGLVDGPEEVFLTYGIEPQPGQHRLRAGGGLGRSGAVARHLCGQARIPRPLAPGPPVLAPVQGRGRPEGGRRAARAERPRAPAARRQRDHRAALAEPEGRDDPHLPPDPARRRKGERGRGAHAPPRPRAARNASRSATRAATSRSPRWSAASTSSRTRSNAIRTS